MRLLTITSEIDTDSITDLKNAHTLGLPFATQWNVTGFPFSWHVQQVQDGHRLLPGKFLFGAFSQTSIPNITPHITHSEYDDFMQATGCPIRLRTNNINTELTRPAYRFPNTTQETNPCVLRLVDGELDDRPFADRLAPASLWAAHGTTWAATTVPQAHFENVPEPAWVSFMENNEGAEEELTEYRNASGGKNALGYVNREWKTPTEIDAFSVRMSDYVEANDPEATGFEVTHGLLRKAQFDALFAAFKAASPDGWNNKTWYSGGYGPPAGDGMLGEPAWDLEQTGYSPRAISYDAPGAFIYQGANGGDFTRFVQLRVLNLRVAWDWLEGYNAKAYREFLIQIEARAVCTGKLNGNGHRAITPAVWGAYAECLYWMLRGENGRPVVLTTYTPASRVPTGLFFDTQEALDKLEEASETALATLTYDDYVQPVHLAADNICTTSLYRDFWLNGTTVINTDEEHFGVQENLIDTLGVYPDAGETDSRWVFLTCSVNTPRDEYFIVKENGKLDYNPIEPVLKVWAVATELNGDYLLYAFTPCTLDEVTVTVPGYGDVEIDFEQEPKGYWHLTGSGVAKL